eukprot:SAG11_NODE_78_length_17939_cov_10.236883_6_plen_50_part_00
MLELVCNSLGSSSVAVRQSALVALKSAYSQLPATWLAKWLVESEGTGEC